MQRRRTGYLGAAELAWLLLALFEHGLKARRRGWCLGELSAGDVAVTRQGIDRARPSRFRRCALAVSRWRHARRGHDPSCYAVGVPTRAAQRILRFWGRPETHEFARSLFEEAVQAAQGSPAATAETLDFVVRNRIAPRMPANRHARRDQGEGAVRRPAG